MNITFYELDSYNSGRLLPFTVDLEPLSSRFEYLEVIKEELAKIKEANPKYNCEEWIVAGYEDVPSSLIGEWDLKKEFWDYKEVLDSGYCDWEVIEAAIDCDIPADKIEDAYQGRWESDEDFAYDLWEQCATKEQQEAANSWPLNCIDWERAAMDLMFDFNSSNNHYFSRNY